MLSELLDLLREGGTRRVSDLAHKLGTTPDLVEAMLESLTRMGRVKRVACESSETCTTCPMSGKACRSAPRGVVGSPHRGKHGQIWVLAEEREGR